MTSRAADVALTPPLATVLVVDDSPVNLQVLVRTLHGTGHRILAARDGKSALDIIKRARPDLVLLDVMMPEVDGFEVCRTIKADADAQDTVVIFLSALGDVSDKVLGLQLGAVDYITKPIQAEEVLARVATHLTRQHLERELRRSRDRLNRELASAGRMQRLILPPRLPEHPGLRFAASYQTSRHAGGDYYDVLPLGGGRFGVMVADVSGHGAPAAIVMAMIRAALHSHPPVYADPAAVFQTLNEHFEYLWDTEMFATAVYATVDAGTREMRMACAGHPPPLLLRAGQAPRTLEVSAVTPLLMMPFGAVPVTSVELRPGDRVLFYTDGVTERLDAGGRMYELPRFEATAAEAAGRPPAALIDHVVADLDRFAAGHEPEDDLTLVAIGLD
jgi:sigma-B regulation protein RsbU (phosphoserine phosphatase)